MIQNIAELKIELMARGMRSDLDEDRGRKGGAGPAGGRFVRLKDGSCGNVPMWPSFTSTSPYYLKNNQVYLNEIEVKDIDLIPIPKFYTQSTSDNIPMKKIALLHGNDCIASTVVQKCIYWKTNQPCQFCGIEFSLQSGSTTAVKTPKQLREVVGAAIDEKVCRHITLTIGSLPRPDKGAGIYADIVQEIKAYYDIPVHVQLEPPASMKAFKDLQNSGVDTVGIHIESFDKTVLQTICPGKVNRSLNNYKMAWKSAVQIFGENQVDSYILAGIGESDDNILEGAKSLLELGVIPYVVPFRPIALTPLASHPTPSATRLKGLFTQIAQLLRDFGADPTKNKAGCVRCGGCSPLTEAFKYL